MGFHTAFNNVYERYSVRAWDFMNHKDFTRRTHHLAFRSWRCYRYTLPDAVVRYFEARSGPHGHQIEGYEGYAKAAQWMAEHGPDQVKSEYSY